MVRSVGEKPVSPGTILEHVLEVRADRACLPAEHRPQRPGEPALGSLACGRAGPRYQRGQIDVAPGSFEWVGSESAIAIRGAARNVGIGDGKLCKDQDLELFHGISLGIRLVIVAGEMKKSMHREMRQMMRKGLMLGARFAVRRLVSDHDIAEQAGDSSRGARSRAGNDKTLVAASLQRQSRLSVRIAASSVSTMASSPSHSGTFAPASAIARRNSAFALRCSFQSAT